MRRSCQAHSGGTGSKALRYFDKLQVWVIDSGASGKEKAGSQRARVEGKMGI